MAKTEGVLAKFRETLTRTTSALRGISGDISALRSHQATLKAQRDVVANAPMSDDEILAKINRSLDSYESIARSSWDDSRFAVPHAHVDGEFDGPVRLYGPAGMIGLLLVLGLRPVMEQALFTEARRSPVVVAFMLPRAPLNSPS